MAAVTTSLLAKRPRPNNEEEHLHGSTDLGKRARKRRQFKYYTRQPVEDSECKLCSRCQSIDFDAIFGVEDIKSEGIPVFDIGQLSNSWNREMDCSLCQFFRELLMLRSLLYCHQRM